MSTVVEEVGNVAGEVDVVYTTAEGTRAALATAKGFSKDLAIAIRLIAVQVVPYPLQIDEPGIGVRAVITRILDELRGCVDPTEIQIDHALCRDHDQGLLRTLKPHSLVLIGGGSRERQTAQMLANRGHQVLFVHARKRSFPSSMRRGGRDIKKMLRSLL